MESLGLRASRIGVAALFLAAGTLHFTHAESFERIVPDALPAAGALVAISGVAEIAGGVGLLVPKLRRPAAIGLVALLAAVLPANVNMAIDHERLAPGVPVALLWARIPLQLVLAWLVLRVGRRPRR
jgi:uncharacterized membrane protein